ncbi:ADP-dependent glucokinase/phosphofructokinase [Mesorhizobium sp. YC-39]|uniref:ADP-dependent glucokinase/phosphofructokinase n=1 Tax=unclassified Mesorhizobium TaxID=325217 RepID=UPI0021E8AA15|nr:MULTISPECIES: ADP-dependent glucokinase/phosphofructokinase [unclassified Mesorhizobium]MCV3207566.1 ADP-dependent glucokinase/phosphofructokinase [Mesorhizobium sp. YC-2]MCV3229293.1 ADP-dependent glucokinase/phosphofructokinase [Mesorhizobium sp. YC-39]
MKEIFTGSWADRYAALTDPRSGPLSASTLSQSGLVLCGISACVDARVDMRDIQPLLDAPTASPAGELASLLLSRAARGIGGEVRFEWPQGPAWLRERLEPRYALGGTGPQAAWVLSRLGVPALIALEDRNEQMLRQIPSGVLLAEGGMLKTVDAISPAGPHIPEIFIFEYTAGQPIGTLMPRRSSRVIVRFCDRGIQRDADFEALSRQLASSAAAGLLSGLNDEAVENVDAASRHVFALSRAWKAAGLKTIHFELAGYASLAAVEELLAHAKGTITSLGMSHSELLAMDPSAQSPQEAMMALAERLDLERVCVHADTWAAAITVNDPREEELALMAGCAIASSRAATGAPAEIITTAPEVQFHAVPFEVPVRKGRWSFVACASPYVEKPATTLGLGDSFTAGCLLMLGRHSRADTRTALKQA